MTCHCLKIWQLQSWSEFCSHLNNFFCQSVKLSINLCIVLIEFPHVITHIGKSLVAVFHLYKSISKMSLTEIVIVFLIIIVL